MSAIRNRLHVIEIKELVRCIHYHHQSSLMLPSTSLLFRLSILNRVPRPIYLSNFTFRTMSDSANSEKKTYHKKATGVALNTVKKHSKDHDLKLYGSCFW